MTQLKSKEQSPSWKEREINGNCEFGVKSYLHQFYDGPESVDLDLYEYEVGAGGWDLEAVCYTLMSYFTAISASKKIRPIFIDSRSLCVLIMVIV